MSRKTRLLIPAIIILLLAGTIAAGLLARVDEVVVAGNSHFGNQEVEDLVFDSGFSRAPLVILTKKLFGGYAFPQFEDIEVSLDGLTGAAIRVKEKKLYGYVPHFGSNLFFDKDGVVIKSSDEVFSDVIRVNGLKVESAVLNEPLQVENQSNFRLVATVIDFLSSHKVTLENITMHMYAAVDEVTIYKGSSVSLKLEELTVLLGKNVNLQEKLLDLSSMLPEVWGKKGTLHMEEYADANSGHVYYFDEK